MGLLDVILGRSRQKPPDLDRIFGLSDAAITLSLASGYHPTGVGSVCYRAAEGGAFAQLQTDVQALLDADAGPKVERVPDEYGFTWLVCRHEPDDVPGLVTDLHAVNSTLTDQGFGSALLCSLVAFTGPDGQRLALVYLYKRGTFYPFVPTGRHETRDTATELSIRAQLGDDLAVESDLSRWFPVWGAPGL